MEEIIECITSTRMPDGEYPVFSLKETENKIQAQFAWASIVIIIGGNIPAGINDKIKTELKEIIILEAAEIFSNKVGEYLDILSKEGKYSP